jgi:hypothetical protein
VAPAGKPGRRPLVSCFQWPADFLCPPLNATNFGGRALAPIRSSRVRTSRYPYREPDRGIQRLLRRTFGASRYAVATANTGTATIGAINQGEPDLIILSAEFSDLSGMELIGRHMGPAVHRSLPCSIRAGLVWPVNGLMSAPTTAWKNRSC